MGIRLRALAGLGMFLLLLAGCGSARPDRRFDSVNIQDAVKAIKPSDVKEICFVKRGEIQSRTVPHTGPVKSPREITQILHAFTNPSCGGRHRRVSGYRETVLIGLKNGRTLVLDLRPSWKRYEAEYGADVARIMSKYEASCSLEQAEADGLYANTYGPDR